MTTLARVIYNPRPGEAAGPLPDPAGLLQHQFGTREDVERHLFDAFIPAAYRCHPDREHRCRWSGEQAQRWLTFLAAHLERNLGGTPDLAWWQLAAAVFAQHPKRPA